MLTDRSAGPADSISPSGFGAAVSRGLTETGDPDKIDTIPRGRREVIQESSAGKEIVITRFAGVHVVLRLK